MRKALTQEVLNAEVELSSIHNNDQLLVIKLKLELRINSKLKRYRVLLVRMCINLKQLLVIGLVILVMHSKALVLKISKMGKFSKTEIFLQPSRKIKTQ